MYRYLYIRKIYSIFTRLKIMKLLFRKKKIYIPKKSSEYLHKHTHINICVKSIYIMIKIYRNFFFII